MSFQMCWAVIKKSIKKDMIDVNINVYVWIYMNIQIQIYIIKIEVYIHMYKLYIIVYTVDNKLIPGRLY